MLKVCSYNDIVYNVKIYLKLYKIYLNIFKNI